MPSTCRKLERKAKTSMAQAASQAAVYAKGLILPFLQHHYNSACGLLFSGRFVVIILLLIIYALKFGNDTMSTANSYGPFGGASCLRTSVHIYQWTRLDMRAILNSHHYRFDKLMSHINAHIDYQEWTFCGWRGREGVKVPCLPSTCTLQLAFILQLYLQSCSKNLILV
jgi:hypothetical protein